MSGDEPERLMPADATQEEREHRDCWLDSLSKEELLRFVRKNSCLCDMAGICNGCKLTDLEYRMNCYIAGKYE